MQATTYEETDELPAKSDACVVAASPPIKMLKFDTQDDATNAVALGRADAMSADSPVTLYAISQTDGQARSGRRGLRRGAVRHGRRQGLRP